MSQTPWTLGVPDLVRRVQQGQISARELVEHSRRRVEELNPRINAFVATDFEAALAEADRVDSAIRAGRRVGGLAGVPVGVKDSQDARGFRTTHGSRIFEGVLPAEQDCLIVQRLRAEDAIVIGKTNTAELEFGPSTDNDLFGVTENPVADGRSAGGSSGGSAAAVAAGMVPLATASDGGGSIRGPAAACGLPALKPTLGVVPHGDAQPPDWPTLSTRGIIAQDVLSTAYAYDIIGGPDGRDPRSQPKRAFLAGFLEPGSLLPEKVAWSADLGWAATSDEVRSVCEAALGAMQSRFDVDVIAAEPLADEDPGRWWSLLAATGTLRFLRLEEHPDRLDLLGSGVRHVLTYFRDATAADIWAAFDVGYRINERMESIFSQAELLLCPTSARAAPDHAAARRTDWVGCTYAFNLANLPAATVPVGRTGDGTPVGLQIVGKRNAEVQILRAMKGVIEAVAHVA